MRLGIDIDKHYIFSVPVLSDTNATKMAEKIATVGVWYQNTFYPAHRITCIKIIKDDGN